MFKAPLNVCQCLTCRFCMYFPPTRTDVDSSNLLSLFKPEFLITKENSNLSISSHTELLYICVKYPNTIHGRSQSRDPFTRTLMRQRTTVHVARNFIHPRISYFTKSIESFRFQIVARSFMASKSILRGFPLS